ncbi:MAG: zinc ribbon domain-containing protein, partial [Bacilli bacterium]
MIKCKNCDHVISDDANFCPVCGSRLEIDAKARESDTAEHEGRRPVIEPKLASCSLGFGIAGFAVAFFLWQITIFCVLAGVFSFLAIFFGIKSMKIQ